MGDNMGISNLFNKNKKIGTVNYYEDNLKRVPKKKHKLVATLVLTANILASVLTGCSSSKQLGEPDNKSSYELINVDEELKTRVYKITTDDTVLYVNSDYLDAHSYVPIDNIETKHHFIQETMNRIFAGDPYSQPMINMYLNYLDVYYKYWFGDNTDAFLQKKYIEYRQNQLIADLKMVLKEDNYIPEAISYEEYIKDVYDPSKAKKDIEYVVKKDDTLSNIISSYADNREEYTESMGYAMTNNQFIKTDELGIPDYDYIVPGQVIKLTNVGVEDYDALGLAVDDNNIDSRILFVKNNIKKINLLPGDMESLKLSNKVKDLAEQVLTDYDSNIYNPDEMLDNLKQLCQDLYLLTGIEYKAKVVEKYKIKGR